MMGDNGLPLKAIIYDAHYVPGQSRRLFSIYDLTEKGHYATFTKGGLTLYFGTQQRPLRSYVMHPEVILEVQVEPVHFLI